MGSGQKVCDQVCSNQQDASCDALRDVRCRSALTAEAKEDHGRARWQRAEPRDPLWIRAERVHGERGRRGSRCIWSGQEFEDCDRGAGANVRETTRECERPCTATDGGRAFSWGCGCHRVGGWAGGGEGGLSGCQGDHMVTRGTCTDGLEMALSTDVGLRAPSQHGTGKGRERRCTVEVAYERQGTAKAQYGAR